MKRILALVLALILLAAGYIYVRRADAEGQSQIRSLSAEVEPLQQEKDRLEKELAALDAEYTTMLRDPSTVQFLFREMYNTIYTDVYPIMRDRGITGVLGFSLRQYPGYGNTLTKSQVNRLLMDGWGTCLVFDLDYRYNFVYWFDYMKQILTRDGFEMPKTIFFPDNAYDPELMDETLLAAGVETVVVNAEDGHSATVSEVGELWYTGAMPWNYTSIENDVARLAVTDGANLVFTVSMQDMWDSFEPESFAAMIDAWSPVLVRESVFDEAVSPTPTSTAASSQQGVEPLLKICSFEEAREAHRVAAESRDSLVREHEERQEELSARIQELTEQISAVYEQWNHK